MHICTRPRDRHRRSGRTNGAVGAGRLPGRRPARRAVMVVQPARCRASIWAANRPGLTTRPGRERPICESGAIRWYMNTGIRIVKPAGGVPVVASTADPDADPVTAATTSGPDATDGSGPDATDEPGPPTAGPARRLAPSGVFARAAGVGAVAGVLTAGGAGDPRVPSRVTAVVVRASVRSTAPTAVAS